jgi:hypothetical protein
MIRGLHGMLYSSKPAEARDFLRDVLRLPFTDVGRGWLIFELPESDVGIHPADGSGGAPPGTHDVSFFCDDIAGTVADLKARGVHFNHDPIDQGYGYVTSFEIPGGIEVQLYEPKYQKRGAKSAAKKPAATAKKPTASKAKKKATKPVAKAKKPARTAPARAGKRAKKRR